LQPPHVWLGALKCCLQLWIVVYSTTFQVWMIFHFLFIRLWVWLVPSFLWTDFSWCLIFCIIPCILLIAHTTKIITLQQCCHIIRMSIRMWHICLDINTTPCHIKIGSIEVKARSSCSRAIRGDWNHINWSLQTMWQLKLFEPTIKKTFKQQPKTLRAIIKFLG